MPCKTAGLKLFLEAAVLRFKLQNYLARSAKSRLFDFDGIAVDLYDIKFIDWMILESCKWCGPSIWNVCAGVKDANS